MYGESLGQQGRVLGSKIIHAENKKTQANFSTAPESGSGAAKAKKNNKKKKGANKGKSGAAGAGGANGKKAGGANEPQVLDPAAIKKRQRKAKEAFRSGRVLLEKLVEGSDLVLVVLDARDPQRCRSTFLERLVKESGKSLVFVLNKTGKRISIRVSVVRCEGLFMDCSSSKERKCAVLIIASCTF